jgi:hypothetical protein
MSVLLRDLLAKTNLPHETYHIPEYGGQWAPSPSLPATHVTFRYFGGGDYSGDTLMAQANREYLLGTIDKEHREMVKEWEAHWSFWFVTFAFPLDTPMPESVATAILDAVQESEDYPILDEDRYSELEIEMHTSNWDNYGWWDALRAITGAFGEDDVSEAAYSAMKGDPYGEVGDRLRCALEGDNGVEMEYPGATSLWPDPITKLKWTKEQAHAVLLGGKEEAA